MKRFSIFLCIVCLLVTAGCKKVVENTKKDPATDFNLKLTRTDAGGNVNSQYENALNMPGSAVFTANYYVKESSIHLKIGGIQTTTVVPRLSVDVHFSFTKQPSDIKGIYTFPADNDKILFSLGEQVGTDFRSLGNPKAGSMEVKYNSTLKALSGTFTGIGFHQTLNSTYVSETLNGKFSNVVLSK